MLQERQKQRIVWLTPDRFDTKADKSSWLEMAKGLKGCGYKVTILAGASRRVNAVKEPDAVTYLGSVNLPLVFRFVLLLNALKWLIMNRQSFDILVVNPDSLWLVPVVRSLLRKHVHLDIRTLPVNIVSTKRRIDRFLFWSIPMRLFGKKPDSYSFITERLRIMVASQFGIDVADYSIWSSGVNTEMFAPPLRQHASSGELRVFYHGSISLKRGLLPLVQAIGLFPPEENVRLTIVGDGPDRQHLEKLAQELKLFGRVEFTGLIPYEDVPQRIGQADLCVCPLPDLVEWNVSSPLKVLEYMACERPIVVTPIPAHTDLLAGSEFTVWTEGFSAVDFHAAITAARARLPELMCAAKSGRRMVRQDYEWRSHATRFARYLTRAASKTGPVEADVRP